MINGLIAKGTLVANTYEDVNLTEADPGYPIQVSVLLNNTTGNNVLVSIYLSDANEQSPSNGDSVYQQYPLGPYANFNPDVICMSSTESILMVASGSGVNYLISGTQSPD